MKIGLVCPYSINEHGGVLEVVLALKGGLENRGHTVKIITPQPRKHEGGPPEDVIFAGTSVDFRTLSFSDTTSQVSSTADTDKIDAMLAEEKFDILNFHEPWMPLLSRQLLQRSNAVNVGTFHAKVTTAMTSRAILKVVAPYLKSVLNYLHVLTAVSDSGAEYVSGMTDQPVTIIPNGIDLKKYRKLPPSKLPKKERPMVLYIGRLENRKGARYLLHAFQLFAQTNPDAQLIIAGDGPDRERLEMMADDLKLHNISFLGFISEDLKRELLSMADIFCSPALFGESFGIVLLEAMAMDAVTIAGNNSGYIGVMQDVGGISIVNPQDTEEFARRMDLLMNEQSLRKLWQKWASEYVKQFDYPRVVEQYEELYKEALKQHGK
ncbi:MAG TPA: glycosyltransferase family 4 protein [Candidatus Saccharimonadales bacterium]|nr:glycosyltransferase family 4 protein [Candidatus Saccharimonadales bacterium]